MKGIAERLLDKGVTLAEYHGGKKEGKVTSRGCRF